MAGIANIVRCYGLSPNQERLFRRLRRGSVVKPTGQEKRSMRVLVECALAIEPKETPGSFVLAEGGQPFGFHLAQSGLFDQIAPGVFKVKG
jgi:hypothetical protein